MVGRLNQYRNIDVVLDAWQRHVDGGGWRGDELVVIGDRTLIIRSLPAYVRGVPARTATPTSSRQCRSKGFPTSTSGAPRKVACKSYPTGRHADRFPGRGPAEYQPPSCPPIGIDDVAGPGRRIHQLADPSTATLPGAAAARHYELRFAVDCVADRL